MQQIMQQLSDILWGTPLLLLISITGIYFTVRSGFFQFRYFRHIISETFGTLFRDKDDALESKGTMSSFEALSVAVGGSVGVANIAGVATAIAAGGPGAVFWMWLSALGGMMIKLVEATLAVYYRTTDSSGELLGGPTVYIQKGLGRDKNFKGWKILAIIFSIGIFSTYFLTLQNYTVSEAISTTFNINPLLVSGIYVILLYFFIADGLKGVGDTAAKVVPPMLLLYVIAGLIIIGKNITLVPATFGLIFKSAFTGHAAIGGFTGVVTKEAIRLGMARAVYSNEAGWGTSPMVHATASTVHPVRQGLWGAFEVFIDTIIVCSITAFVVIITGVWSNGMTGAELTLFSLEQEFGMIGRVILSISIFLLGVTTSGGWFVYYETILRHLASDKVWSKAVLTAYKWTYPLPGAYLTYLAIVGNLPGKAVWLVSDISSAIPTFINVACILLLSGKFFELLSDYKARYLGVGSIDENFKIFDEK